MKLISSKIIFDNINHTYWLNKKQLSGITGMINEHLFPNKFDNIPAKVLDKATERGSQVHEACFKYDLLGVMEMPEVGHYKAIKDICGIEVLKNEYIVSDNKNFASPIDIVAMVNGSLSLIDIKASYELDIEYLRWQLGIYKYLFELQNPTLKVKKVFGLHLRKDTCSMEEVEPVSKEHVLELMNTHLKGGVFENPLLPKTSKEQQEKALNIINSINNIAKEIAQAKVQEQELKEQLLSTMKGLNIDKWDTDLFTVSLRKAYRRSSFDTKRFKEEYPDLSLLYEKQTEVKESINFKLKNQ